jgi:hypothetical protein
MRPLALEDAIIPKNITREHILNAMAKIDTNDVSSCFVLQ